MVSEINPQEEEFFTNLRKVTQDGYLLVKKIVKSSKIFSRGGKHVELKELPAYESVTSELSGYVDHQINKIIDSETLFLQPGESNDIENNEEQFVKTNNNILERFYQNFEEVCNMDIFEDNADNVGNDQNVPPAGQLDQAMEVDANVAAEVPDAAERRQVDNLDDIWVPKICYKTNSIVPLELKLIYDINGQAIGYEHPYKTELDMYEPPSAFTELEPEPIPLPAPVNDTNFTMVDTQSKLQKLLRHLRGVKEFAVDVEHHSYRSYQGITCLIQITTAGGDYIIDAIALKDHLHKLNYSFTDPKKIKILHGADMDVLWLQRDFGVYIVGLFDTFRAAKLLQLKYKSLKALLNYYCQIDTDKKYQTADWRIRPLPKEMITYARTDTHYLLYIWKRLKNEILKERANKEMLRHVFEESRQVCSATYKKHKITDRSYIEFYRRNKKKVFSTRQMSALKLLFKWRDSYARRLNESPSYILPNQAMLALADRLPEDLQTVIECCQCGRTTFRQKYETIRNIIKTCLDMSEEAMRGVAQEVAYRPEPRNPRPRGFRHRMLDVRHARREPSAEAEPELVGEPAARQAPDEGPRDLQIPRQLEEVAVEDEESSDSKESSLLENDAQEESRVASSSVHGSGAGEPEATGTEEAKCEADVAEDMDAELGRSAIADTAEAPLEAGEGQSVDNVNTDEPAPSTSRQTFYEYTNPEYENFYSTQGNGNSKLKKRE